MDRLKQALSGDFVYFDKQENPNIILYGKGVVAHGVENGTVLPGTKYMIGVISKNKAGKEEVKTFLFPSWKDFVEELDRTTKGYVYFREAYEKRLKECSEKYKKSQEIPCDLDL